VQAEIHPQAVPGRRAAGRNHRGFPARCGAAPPRRQPADRRARVV